MVRTVEPYFQLLEQSPLFTGLGKEEIRRLIELSEVQRFGAGEVVVAEGSRGDAFFLLCDGALQVCTEKESGGSVVLAELRERGACFGEVAIVDPGPRSATVKAEADVVLLKVYTRALEEFFAERQEAQVVVLRNIGRILAQRLRHSNVLLGSMASS